MRSLRSLPTAGREQYGSLLRNGRFGGWLRLQRLYDCSPNRSMASASKNFSASGFIKLLYSEGLFRFSLELV